MIFAVKEHNIIKHITTHIKHSDCMPLVCGMYGTYCVPSRWNTVLVQEVFDTCIISVWLQAQSIQAFLIYSRADSAKD